MIKKINKNNNSYEWTFNNNIYKQNFINPKDRNILLCNANLQQIYTGDRIVLQHKMLIECPDCN